MLLEEYLELNKDRALTECDLSLTAMNTEGGKGLIYRTFPNGDREIVRVFDNHINLFGRIEEIWTA